MKQHLQSLRPLESDAPRFDNGVVSIFEEPFAFSPIGSWASESPPTPETANNKV